MFRTVYINLDKDTARRESMEHQLTRLDIPCERFSAIDGRIVDITHEYDEVGSAQNNAKPLTPGEIGCALSHKRCHTIALEQSYTLILEDDIILPDGFRGLVEREIEKNERSHSWEYLSFDYPPVGLIFIKHWFLSVRLYYRTHIQSRRIIPKVIFWLYTVLKFFVLVPLVLFEAIRNDLYTLLGVHGPVIFFRSLYFAGCYLVTNEGAQKLLSLEDRIVYAADRIHNQARIKKGLKVRAFCPLIAWQNREIFGSSILGVDSIRYK